MLGRFITFTGYGFITVNLCLNSVDAHFKYVQISCVCQLNCNKAIERKRRIIDYTWPEGQKSKIIIQPRLSVMVMFGNIVLMLFFFHELVAFKWDKFISSHSI